MGNEVVAYPICSPRVKERRRGWGFADEDLLGLHPANIGLLDRKIGQQSQRQPGRFEVGANLSIVGFTQAFNSFQLHDQAILDQQIKLVGSDKLPFVKDRHFLLGKNDQSATGPGLATVDSWSLTGVVAQAPPSWPIN